MRKLFYVILLLLIPTFLFAGPVTIEDRTADNFEQLTVSNSEKKLSAKYIVPVSGDFKGFNASEVFITVETANIRYCIDGTTASTSVCHILTSGQNLTLRNKTEIKNFSAFRDDTSDATIGVTYRYGG